jgi:KDO2-lipid IV(A) lauroyltransferase
MKRAPTERPHPLLIWSKTTGDRIVGTLVVGLLRCVRLLDVDGAADLFGKIMRKVGPMLPEHKTGRANLAAAFPEKSDEEREAILLNVWQHMGYFGAEFAKLDSLWDFDPARPTAAGRVESDEASVNHAIQMRDDGKGALIFAGHLGNWELTPLASTQFGINSAVVFRPPNNQAVADSVQRLRMLNMGMVIPTRFDTPLRVGRLLDEGMHVGMLVDQHYSPGVEVTFFGRKVQCNPLLGRLARQVECPIYGVRIVRLPGHRFRSEFTDEIPPVRDAKGKIDVQGTMQAITSVIEGWIREYPDQWLWLHRRWR